jgi:hypothetical protein
MLERYRASLLELFSATQRLRAARGKDPVLCLELQERLLERITYVEGRIRRVKSEFSRTRHLLRGGAPARLSKAEARGLKDAISYHRAMVGEYQHLLILLHQIGDAIALTYLDKWDIKPLAFHQEPGFISGKKGTRLERRIMRTVFQHSGIAILNDLTTCLRHGDVTIPLNGPFTVFEAKSGRQRSKRDYVQEAALQKVMNYVLSDRAENLFGQKATFVRKSLSVPERNHLGWLNRLIKQAARDGDAARQVERGLYYIVTYSGDTKLLKKAIQCCGSPPMVGLVNAFKYTNNGHYPFTLSISDPAALFDFYAGSLIITVIVDPAILTDDFAARGYQIEFLKSEDYAFTLIGARPSILHNKVDIGRHFWNRIYIEFLSLHWYVEELSQRFAARNSSDFGPSEA